jgi:hypothetical protein
MKARKGQYFIYGLLVPVAQCVEWEEKTGEDFNDTLFTFMNFRENVSFTGRDGRFNLVGRVFNKPDDPDAPRASGSPVTVPDIPDAEKDDIKAKVKGRFGWEGEFNLYFIKIY